MGYPTSITIAGANRRLRFDHGIDGRANFIDVGSGEKRSLSPIAFDPASRARVNDCPSGDFEHSPECWNLAASGRRVWGIAVRPGTGPDDPRLYYAVLSDPA
jgi:hypothetical protein